MLHPTPGTRPPSRIRSMELKVDIDIKLDVDIDIDVGIRSMELKGEGHLSAFLSLFL